MNDVEPGNSGTHPQTVAATDDRSTQFVLSDKTLSDYQDVGAEIHVANAGGNESPYNATGDYYQDVEQTERGSEQLDPQSLISRLQSSLSDQPLGQLYAYPETATAGSRFPERFSRQMFDQSEVAAPWTMENDFRDNSPQVGFTQVRDSNFIPWIQKYSAWTSPNFKSNPLYFEQINAERYGIHSPNFVHARSAAHFFVSIPLLPLKTVLNHPCDCAYSLGHYRPGSCHPAFRYGMPVKSRSLASRAQFANIP